MADIADIASEITEQNIEMSLQQRPLPQMTYTGECHYCEESIDKGHFCSHECREDSEKLARASMYRRI